MCVCVCVCGCVCVLEAYPACIQRAACCAGVVNISVITQKRNPPATPRAGASRPHARTRTLARKRMQTPTHTHTCWNTRGGRCLSPHCHGVNSPSALLATTPTPPSLPPNSAGVRPGVAPGGEYVCLWKGGAGACVRAHALRICNASGFKFRVRFVGRVCVCVCVRARALR